MPLLEDNQEDRLIIERFEKRLMELLEAHAAYQKQISQLIAENKALKGLLEASKTGLNSPMRSNDKALDNLLIDQINKYIKEIDSCLTYFEQI